MLALEIHISQRATREITNVYIHLKPWSKHDVYPRHVAKQK